MIAPTPVSTPTPAVSPNSEDDELLDYGDSPVHSNDALPTFGYQYDFRVTFGVSCYR